MSQVLQTFHLPGYAPQDSVGFGLSAFHFARHGGPTLFFYRHAGAGQGAILPGGPRASSNGLMRCCRTGMRITDCAQPPD